MKPTNILEKYYNMPIGAVEDRFKKTISETRRSLPSCTRYINKMRLQGYNHFITKRIKDDEYIVAASLDTKYPNQLFRATI